MNKNEWNVCDGKLKDMASGTEMNYSDKYQKTIRITNMHNCIILTNHKAVKRPDGRIYYVDTINTNYSNDHEFLLICAKHVNDKVGYAVYNDLMELDLADFNSLIMPETQTKMDMNPIENFLE